jgi:hypothetical protein
LPALQLLRNDTLRKDIYDVDTQLPLALVREIPPFAVRNKRICICVGSRFIKQQVPILEHLVRYLETQSAKIIIIPVMGSHGGATSTGQQKVLASYGITEQTMGVPIISEIVPDSLPVDNPVLKEVGLKELYVDHHALQSDGIILINRVKPHTSFAGPIQSGLCKMCCIGLGKARGAAAYHQVFDALGFSEALPLIVSELIAKIPVLGGLALVENGVGDIAHVAVLRADQFLEEEPGLLKMAIEQMPSIPILKSDLLLVDEIGKGVSGSGMDTNIIGKKQDIFAFQPKLIYARRLAEGSAGNAVGMGLADVVHTKLVEQVDFPASYINAETSLSPGSVKIPITYASDQKAWDALLRLCGHAETKAPRVVWIRNTSDLRFILTNCPCPETWHQVADSITVSMDAEGNLPDFTEIVQRYTGEVSYA